MVDLNKDHWTITPLVLSDVINSKRKKMNKSPIDHDTMMTRLLLKSNVSHPGLFDFEAKELRMDASGIKVMEELLYEQFGLRMESRLSRHCTSVSPAIDITEEDTVVAETPVPPPQKQKKSDFMYWLSRMFIG